MNQVELHKKIDELLVRGPSEAKREDVSALVLVNQDARHYFFAKADERWLDWLWENRFLDVIKQKAEDPTKYSYRTSELNYLVRMVGKLPAKVVDIILKVPVSKQTFNPEVVDQFLRICSNLPAEQLTRLVLKIRNERWIPLMGVFNQWGFEYEKMLQVLADAKNYKSILVLAEAILAVRTKEEIEKTNNRISTDNPFYFSDLSYTKVFEHLVNIDSKYTEQALALVTKVMAKIVLLGGKTENSEVFSLKETFYLFDVDFFTLELGEKENLSHRDDVREVAAVIKVLLERLIGKRCDRPADARLIYEKYIEPLPESRSMWRLRLFVLSLCPSVFKDELKQAFFRIFETDRYHELISGTEYQKTLRVSFSVLSEGDKRKYVNQVLEYFSKHAEDKKDEKWHKMYGWEILSSICGQLMDKENTECEKVFGKKCDPKYEPEPSIGKMRGGFIKPKGPITLEEFGNLPISNIALKLRTEWTPEKLRKQNTSDDFLNPLNAEGAGELLRADTAKRLQDYIQNASLFFERDVLDQHYTYSFLRGIEETFRENKADVGDINWDGLINLCAAIVQSGEDQPFENGMRERDTFDAWLSGWDGVHSVMADVIQKLITEDNGKTAIDFLKYRDTLFVIIRYLLAYPDPVPEDEKIESAKMKTKSPDSEEYLVSEPFTMAINTVRGRTFQAFTLFVYQDGKKFSKEEKSKLSLDVKKLYEAVLKNEKTRALFFMFGHYLPSLYFRDTEWIRGLLPQIFPADSDKKDLYLAAWEGYLTTNLYKELFVELQDFYSRAIGLNTEDYTKRRYFKDLDEALATHLALAFVHFADFSIESDLSQAFWQKQNTKRHKEFISFIGRHCISRERADLWIKENKIDLEKLKLFWDWVLQNCKDKETFTAFGFWIKAESPVLEQKWLAERIKKTLEKTSGEIEWDYGLTESLPALAKADPKETLNILRLYLSQEIAPNKRRGWIYVEQNLVEVFRTLYMNPPTREGTYALINDLLPLGNGQFWKLKEVLN
jgi:hypothetical protein